MNYGTAAAYAGMVSPLRPPAKPAPATMHGSPATLRISSASCGSATMTTPTFKMEGAHAAAPIWGEFMKRAIQLPQYSDVKPFSAPEGVTTAHIDKTSNLLVDSTCPDNSLYVAFLDGTAPVNTCSQMGENPQNFIQKIFGIGGNKPATPDAARPAPRHRLQRRAHRPHPAQHAARRQRSRNHPATRPPKKKNFLQKIFGGGKDKDKQPQPQSPPPQ